jgi:transmembrane sensor
MESQEQNLLFEKYVNNQATAEETRHLLTSFQQTDESQLKQLILNKLQSLDSKQVSSDSEDALLEEIYIKVKGDINKKPSVLWYKIAAAAALFIIGGYFYSSSLKTKYVERPVPIALSSATAGKEDAILTLANGRKIQINKAAMGIFATDAGSNIRKTKEGEILYEASINGQSSTVQNIIETPKGRQFKLQLPDGTNVWLNAGSSIKYPVSFTAKKERIVELIGEAYFEVFHNKTQPFVVKSAGQIVEVLGTHFNINSYANEGKTVTTLAEGSVKVTAKNSSTIIKPEQQAVLTAGRSILVRQAELKVALAWKDGKFKFRDTAMPEIMRQIARWYDIDIKYSGSVPTDLFSGTISRQADLSQVLQIFAITEVHFELVQESKGKTLIIKP